MDKPTPPIHVTSTDIHFPRWLLAAIALWVVLCVLLGIGYLYSLSIDAHRCKDLSGYLVKYQGEFECLPSPSVNIIDLDTGVVYTK